jgi:hypothetical protein
VRPVDTADIIGVCRRSPMWHDCEEVNGMSPGSGHHRWFDSIAPGMRDVQPAGPTVTIVPAGPRSDSFNAGHA